MVNEHRQLVLGTAGRGIHRKLVHLGDAGQGIHRQHGGLLGYLQGLAERMRRVRVCSGDWSRVCGPSVTEKHGITGVFLDPPYADTAERCADIYTVESLAVAHDVREWALAQGDNPLMRIALCGYEGEHVMPDSWSVVAWNAGQGYGGRAAVRTGNGQRERIWFSPSCLAGTGEEEQQRLFAMGELSHSA